MKEIDKGLVMHNVCQRKCLNVIKDFSIRGILRQTLGGQRHLQVNASTTIATPRTTMAVLGRVQRQAQGPGVVSREPTGFEEP